MFDTLIKLLKMAASDKLQNEGLIIARAEIILGRKLAEDEKEQLLRVVNI